MEPTRTLCANGCGFYGTPENNHLCSKCFKEFLKETESISFPPCTSSCMQVTSASEEDKSFSPPDGVVDSDQTSSNGKDTGTKCRRRCESCSKKVGLLGFECRCGGMFCSVHRYAEMHACKFDFKGFERQLLAKANPLCVTPKLKDRI